MSYTGDQIQSIVQTHSAPQLNNILVTLTGVVDIDVSESRVALQVYTPACEVLREVNFSSLEYVGPDPVTPPIVKVESVEIIVPPGSFLPGDGGSACRSSNCDHTGNRVVRGPCSCTARSGDLQRKTYRGMSLIALLLSRIRSLDIIASACMH